MGTKSVPTDPIAYAKALKTVKARVAQWPSAYASGQVVILYKETMKKKNKPAYTNTVNKKDTALARWYKEDWINIATGKPCGTHAKNTYPTCRPNIRVNAHTPVTANELTPKQKLSMINQKQKAKRETVHYKETQNVILKSKIKPHTI